MTTRRAKGGKYCLWITVLVAVVVSTISQLPSLIQNNAEKPEAEKRRKTRKNKTGHHRSSSAMP